MESIDTEIGGYGCGDAIGSGFFDNGGFGSPDDDMGHHSYGRGLAFGFGTIFGEGGLNSKADNGYGGGLCRGFGTSDGEGG